MAAFSTGGLRVFAKAPSRGEFRVNQRTFSPKHNHSFGWFIKCPKNYTDLTKLAKSDNLHSIGEDHWLKLKSQTFRSNDIYKTRYYQSNMVVEHPHKCHHAKLVPLLPSIGLHYVIAS